MVKRFNYINKNEQFFSLKDKKIIIWGRSVSGISLYVKLKYANHNIIGFTDSFADNSNETFVQLPVYTAEQIRNMGDVCIYISTVNIQNLRSILELIEKLNLENATVICERDVYGAGEYPVEDLKKKIENDKLIIEEVRENLNDEFSKKTLDNLINYRLTNDTHLIREVFVNEHKQYFPGEDILKPSCDEVFLDVGACNGSTSFDFSEWVNGKYEKIYMFEPDKTMYYVCMEYAKLKNINNVQFVNKAAYSHSELRSFNENFLSGSSSLKENGTSMVECASIDDILVGERATYIKMDVEGAEMEALLGCEKTIQAYRPKLAISIYHKDDDLWKIPYYLMKKYPFYKFYMRHYTSITTETVLYATE